MYLLHLLVYKWCLEYIGTYQQSLADGGLVKRYAVIIPMLPWAWEEMKVQRNPHHRIFLQGIPKRTLRTCVRGKAGRKQGEVRLSEDHPGGTKLTEAFA